MLQITTKNLEHIFREVFSLLINMPPPLKKEQSFQLSSETSKSYCIIYELLNNTKLVSLLLICIISLTNKCISQNALFVRQLKPHNLIKKNLFADIL